MKNPIKLTDFEDKLLRIAFLVMEEDMSYEQEEKIMKKANACVEDLYRLKETLKNNKRSKDYGDTL